MAGETDDCISLQAECLPTGSISFGRFETESLAWERRSSFSHNRYLEEVEKYSTPGSVTQKKAYFEAHFKKKGLLHQTSSLSQSGSEGHRGDYGSECQMNHIDKHEDNFEESEQYGQFHNHEKDGIQFSWYDESPLASDEIVHEGVDGEEVTSVSALIDIGEDVSNSNYVGDLSNENVHESSEFNKPSKQDGSQINDEPQRVITTADSSATHEMRETTPEKTIFEVDSAPVPVEAKKPSSKGKSSIGTKTSTLKSKIQSGIQPARKSSADKRSVSSVATLTSSKDPRKTVKESILRPNSERPSSQRVSVTASASKHKKTDLSSKAKDSPVDKTKEKPNRSKPTSDNNIKARKIGANLSEKRVPSTRLSTNRADLRAGAAGFSFKSDERAEKRKEFYMKLEEKLHAKEVQMNEIQARTQEEKDAAMKQFRRSLNFKATPMPSFYHEAASGISNGKKAPRTTAKPSKAHVKHMNPADEDNDIDESLRVQNTTNPTALTNDQSIMNIEQGSSAPECGVDTVMPGGQDEIAQFAGSSAHNPLSAVTAAAETAELAKEDKTKIKMRQQHQQPGAAKSKKEYKISKGRSANEKTVKAISGSAGMRAVRVAS